MNAPWLIGKRQSAPRLRLFCFSYAGGSASAYASWQAALGPQVEVCAIQLPGRDMRMAEAPCTSLDQLLPQLLRAVQGVDGMPFAFFGHSLGALVAFELTRLLRRHGMPLPQRLIVSGACAPRCRDTTRQLHSLPDAAFIDALRAYEGSPAPVLDNADLMELLLPMIRADFQIGERYLYRPSLPLPLPITVFSGTRDGHVPQQGARSWEQESSVSCTVQLFEGGHFFIHTAQAAVLDCLAATLQESQILA